MTLGQVKGISYPGTGTYEWKYKLTLTDNQILYSHSKLKIEMPVLILKMPANQTSAQTIDGAVEAQATGNALPPNSCLNVVEVPFTGTRQYAGAVNTATLQIKYAQNNCKIRKPLIVVEGFDSGLLGVENSNGENDYFSFRKNVVFSGSNDLYFGIYSNYDIIYINFNQGRDDLRRNAYLVEDIIAWVNTKKAQASSTTPNVVIGQSMGGVIARYALRDMEVLGQAHQTRLFLSHDAPQQGANIPLGIQYFARHLANQFIDTPVGDRQISIGEGANISIGDIQNLLDAPGTKQLLANRIDSNFNLNNTEFNAFQTELRNLGYPTQTRNIALSNGNHCASPQAFNPGATLFSLNGSANTTALTTFLTALIEPLTGISSAPLAYELNEPGLLLGMLPGSSSFAMNFNANALPAAGTTNQIYHGSISYTKKIFSLFGWDPKITVSLTDRSYNNPVALSYDYYPGGQYQLPFNFETPGNSAEDWINIGINVYVAPSFNFIPTPSALDIGRGATPLENADYLKKYNAAAPPVGSKATPFTNFTTSFPNSANTNEQHISFNTRSGNWLATELDNDANNNDIFDCTYICSGAEIIGANTLCTTSTYSAPGVALNYNWTITYGAHLVTLTGNGTKNATLTATGNQSGNVTLSLSMSSPDKCGTVTITKKIWVGVPVFALVRSSAQSETCDSKYHYVPFEVRLPENTGLDILYVNPGVTYTATENNTYTFKFLRNYSGSLILNAIATNACGSYFYESEGEYAIATCASGGYANIANLTEDQSFYKLYPNPSSSLVNIELKDQNFKPAANSQINATLYNMMSEPKGNVQITNNIASINVGGLPQGIYILKINIDGVIESHQIAVQ